MMVQPSVVAVAVLLFPRPAAARLWSPVAVAVLLSPRPATATLPSPLAVAVLLSPSSPAVAVLLSPGANYESAAQEPEATGCVNPLPS